MEPRILDQTETETLYQINVVGDLTISILVCEDGEEYSTKDWQGPQPKTIAEAIDYDWVNLADWAWLTH